MRVVTRAIELPAGARGAFRIAGDRGSVVGVFFRN
jgi:hypothetical protein